MNMILPATIGVAAISCLASFLVPPLLVAVAPFEPPPGTHRCEGYFPDTEVCLPLGTKRPPWFRKNRANADCPQWRIDPKWVERTAFTSKLNDIEATAKEWESILISMTAEDLDKCGGEEAVKPPVWIRQERGVAWSRIQEGIIAGNSEFHCDRPEDQGGHICWTDAVLPMYVEECGVKPSEEFILFVSTFDVQEFRSKMTVMKQKCAS
mmetsp:Transcript_16543/g.36012  ORF Transcript_16543/g.36012 Transcript_16543/m.36012 type:complete len:209 (-) Transcript_16543:124-750(-)